MGVAGCGKTSVAQAIVARLGGCLIEGDAFHPQVNVDKMRRGIALTDQDRRGWLDRLVQELAAAQQGGDHAVLACSALKRRYRDRLRAGGACLGFVFLQLPEAEALSRVAQRVGHFMPDSLVASQFADLEPPSAEALVLTVDATLPVQAIAEQVAHWYARIQSGGNKSD
ncbi:gluconokinase [Bordetella sp. FB-8]|uniref:gluconokinase n=1 Tax=Bordetella sp. FB-8 TaxID=1159870 RepID=UPI0003821928|nr:gluconokinase [Bordetella sp. FB-8]